MRGTVRGCEASLDAHRAPSASVPQESRRGGPTTSAGGSRNRPGSRRGAGAGITSGRGGRACRTPGTACPGSAVPPLQRHRVHPRCGPATRTGRGPTTGPSRTSSGRCIRSIRDASRNRTVVTEDAVEWSSAVRRRTARSGSCPFGAPAGSPVPVGAVAVLCALLATAVQSARSTWAADRACRLSRLAALGIERQTSPGNGRSADTTGPPSVGRPRSAAAVRAMSGTATSVRDPASRSSSWRPCA